MPESEVNLATDAGFRPVVWPRYDVEEDLEVVFKEFGEALGGETGVTLCLLHDAGFDIPLLDAFGRVRDVLNRTLGDEHGLDILLVDDVAGPEGWDSLRGAVSCALALPSSDEGPRAEFLSRLGLPVLGNAEALRSTLAWVKADPAGPPVITADRSDLFLVRGESGEGKSSLVYAFLEQAAPSKELGDPDDWVRTRATMINLDRMYVRYVRRDCAEKIPPEWGVDGLFPYISEHFTDTLNDEEREGYLGYVTERIETAFETTDRHVIVEGWHLLSLLGPLHERFRQRVNVIPVEVDGHTVRVADEFEFNASVEDGRDIEGNDCTPQEKNLEAARALLDWLKERHLQELAPLTTYQCFDDLGQPANNSNSRAKLDSLNVEDLTGRRVLDIGCNAGFFSIQARKRGASHVLGIDTTARDIELAGKYRDLIYELDNVDFERADVFGLEGEGRFDTVLCLSVFHYFRARQPEFLQLMHRLISPDGVLVLECGLSQQHPGQPFVEKAARSVDGDNPCHFPNREALLEMAEGFELVWEGLSTQQLGDAIPRTVLHLRRI